MGGGGMGVIFLGRGFLDQLAHFCLELQQLAP